MKNHGFLPSVLLCAFLMIQCVSPSELKDTWSLAERAQKPSCEKNLTSSLPPSFLAKSLHYLPLPGGSAGLYWGEGVMRGSGKWFYHFFAEDYLPSTSTKPHLTSLLPVQKVLAVDVAGDDVVVYLGWEQEDDFKIIRRSLLEKTPDVQHSLPQFVHASDFSLSKYHQQEGEWFFMLTAYKEHFLAQKLTPLLKPLEESLSLDFSYRYLGFFQDAHKFASLRHQTEGAQLTLRSFAPLGEFVAPVPQVSSWALYPVGVDEVLVAWVQGPQMSGAKMISSPHLYVQLWKVRDPAQPLKVMVYKMNLGDHSELSFFSYKNREYLKVFSSLHPRKVLQVFSLENLEEPLLPQLYGAWHHSATVVQMLHNSSPLRLVVREQLSEGPEKSFSLCSLEGLFK